MTKLQFQRILINTLLVILFNIVFWTFIYNKDYLNAIGMLVLHSICMMIRGLLESITPEELIELLKTTGTNHPGPK